MYVIPDFEPRCFGGPCFLTESQLSYPPIEISEKISNAEWSAAMRHLQAIAMETVPCEFTDCLLDTFCGLCWTFGKQVNEDKLFDRLGLAIREINAKIFSPRQLFLSLQYIRATSSGPGIYVLVIALTPEESKILQQEDGHH